MDTPQSFEEIPLASGLTLYHRGPPIAAGALPTLFYFSLSGSESLNSAPYNQPVMAWSYYPLRVISLTLPEHHGNLPHSNVMHLWAKQLLQGHDIISPFLSQCQEAIDFLIEENIAAAGALGVAGLSRGSFIATHLLARDERISAALGFAPLVTLDRLEKFHGSPPALACSLSLMNKIPQLTGRRLRYYIGNRDHLVGTDTCFSFIQQLTEASYQLGERSPTVELRVFPSIGYKGHGTPPPIFAEGAQWLASQLLQNN